LYGKARSLRIAALLLAVVAMAPAGWSQRIGNAISPVVTEPMPTARSRLQSVWIAADEPDARKAIMAGTSIFLAPAITHDLCLEFREQR
jgi:hypothetical protein